MRLTLTGLAFALAISAPAHAQDVWDDAGGIETAWTGEAALVLAPDADEPALFLVAGGFSANYVFQNGVEAGFRGSAGMQYDHPGRAGFSGLSVLPSRPSDLPAPFRASPADPATKTSVRAAPSKRPIYMSKAAMAKHAPASIRAQRPATSRARRC